MSTLILPLNGLAMGAPLARAHRRVAARRDGGSRRCSPTPAGRRIVPWDEALCSARMRRRLGVEAAVSRPGTRRPAPRSGSRCGSVEVSTASPWRAAGPVAQAVVRRAQVRAALDHAPRDALAGRGTGAQHGRRGAVGRRERVARPLPHVAGHVVAGRSRWAGRCRPARCPRSRRLAGSATGTRPARCWPSCARPARTRRPRRTRAPSSPPRAAYSHSASVGSALPAQAA